MNRLPTLALTALLSALLALPALAAGQGKQAAPAPAEQTEVIKADPATDKAAESEGRKLQKAYHQKREAAKKHRDEMLKLREQAVESGN